MSHITSLMAASLLAFSAVAHPVSERTVSKADMIYSFEDVLVSSNLTWVPCYERFHCANLEVPLDYEDASAGTTIIAWLRLNAANSTDQDIIFNPGGPGASGINLFLQGSGDFYLQHFGGKYNMVTFDPRGSNNSGPALTCFPDDPQSRDAYAASRNINVPITEIYSQAVAEGQWCTAANNETNARYAGTSAVVQDIIHFTELQAALHGQNPKETKIWYFGVSYGTVIGQTLAATYPNRIGRVIVDSNVNSDEYYTGLQLSAIEDSDAAYELFFESCSQAGPEKCAFAGNSTTAKDIKDRFIKLLEKLEKEPLIVNSGRPLILTKTAVLRATLQALYHPIAKLPEIATLLAGLENGNDESLQTSSGSSDLEMSNFTAIAESEALKLITSIDSAGQFPIKNIDDYLKIAKELEKNNYFYGEMWAKTNLVAAAGMGIIPPKSQLFTGFKQTKTDSPILFINTVADPVTPLSSAKHMSKYFEGSVVLAQNSGGHSVMNTPSKCIHDHIIKYLDDGILPKDGTLCEVDQKPFENAATITQKMKREIYKNFF